MDVHIMKVCIYLGRYLTISAKNIKLCYILLVINHMIDDGIPSNETTTEDPTPTSCVIRPVEQQTSVTTVTTTVQPPATTVTRSIPLIITSTTTRISFITITETPQSSCSNTGQQQTSSSSSSTSASNAVTICVPIVVVSAMIILIVLVVTIIFIWWRIKSKSETLIPNGTPTIQTIQSDLNGLVYSDYACIQ